VFLLLTSLFERDYRFQFMNESPVRLEGKKKDLKIIVLLINKKDSFVPYLNTYLKDPLFTHFFSFKYRFLGSLVHSSFLHSFAYNVLKPVCFSARHTKINV